MRQAHVLMLSTLMMLHCSLPAHAQWSSATPANGALPEGVQPAVSGTGTADYIPMWLTSTKQGNSRMYQSKAGDIGVGTTTPDATLDVNGTVNAATGFNLGEQSFAFGTFNLGNAFLGFAGNTTLTGGLNTAVGAQALISNTTGGNNAVVGTDALVENTTGSNNTAIGAQALEENTTGYCNTAVGESALLEGTTGDCNVAIGYFAQISGNYTTCVGADCAAGNGLTNATAIGAFATVTESNALVLGCVSSFNRCATSGGTTNPSPSVGIGTVSPTGTLDVVDNSSGGNTISATTAATGASAVFASNTATSGQANGGFFNTYSPSGTAVVGINYGTGGSDLAGYFQGNVVVTGNLSKGSGSFQIDHPLDPANKYLYHSFVESPDMMNIYNGVITLDAHGSAWVTLPEYFEALNQDFRYQLTAIGKPGPNLYIARKIEGNRFRISGGKPNAEVSWQVTGIRHDAYADAHRIQVEVQKPPAEQGRYLHPELFGAPAERAIGYQPPTPSMQPTQTQTARASSLQTPHAALK